MQENVFLRSHRELKRVNTLIIVAVLISLNLVIDRATIILSPALHISFKFLTSAVIGMLFGPTVGMYAGGVNDILAFIAYPKGMFFPGYTVTAICSGLLYGLFLYEKKITLWRVFFTKAAVNLLCNLCLNTLWSSILMGKAFLPLMAARALKNVALLPIEVMLLYGVILLVQKAYSATVARR